MKRIFRIRAEPNLMLTCDAALFIEFKAVPAILSFRLTGPAFLSIFHTPGR
jgi:hypothetical protein